MAQTIASLLIKIGVQVSEVNKGFKQVESKMKGLTSKFQKTGKSIGGAYKVIGAAAVAGFAVAVKAASDFQSELVGLGRIAGVEGKALQDLGNKAMKMGAEFGVASKDVAKGMADMAKLGYKANEILKEFPSILKFAKVKSIDFTKALSLTESAMSVFKLGVGGAKKVTDAFIYTMDHSTATIDDLKQGFKYAAPAAKAAGLSIGDLSAAIGILAKNGTTGSTAGTTLRMGLNRLASDLPAVKKGFNRLGISVTTSTGKFKPFKQIIAEMSKALDGLSESEQLSTVNMIFGTQAGSGFLKILKEGPEVFKHFAEGADNAGGAVDRAFVQKQNTFKEAMNRFNVAIGNLGIAFGTLLLPGLTKVVDWLGKFIEKVSEFNIDGLNENIKQTWEDIKTTFKDALEEVGRYINEKLIEWDILWDKHGKDIDKAFGKAIKDTWEDIKAATDEAWVIITDIIDTALHLIEGALTVWADVMNGEWEKAWDDLWETADRLLNDVLKTLDDILGKFPSKALNWMREMMGGLIKGINDYIPKLKKAIGVVASIIGGALHHSHPDYGPLKNDYKWMPDMMNMFAQGIEMGIPKLQMAVGDVAATIASGEMAAATSNVKNVNNNVNVYPRQARLDARGLNRELERMRFLNGGMF